MTDFNEGFAWLASLAQKVIDKGYTVACGYSSIVLSIDNHVGSVLFGGTFFRVSLGEEMVREIWISPRAFINAVNTRELIENEVAAIPKVADWNKTQVLKLVEKIRELVPEAQLPADWINPIEVLADQLRTNILG